MKKNTITFFLILLIILVRILTYIIFTFFAEFKNSSQFTNILPEIKKVSVNKGITQINSSLTNRQNQIKEKINLYGKNINGIPVLMYHFFYDPSIGEKGIDNNFLEISKFEQHLNYLKESDFFFPSFEELELFIDGKLELPAKSIILTVDDGNDTFFRLAIPIIEKYKIPVTSFVITGECNYNLDQYKSDYVHFESHSNDMHKAGKNGKGLLVNSSYNKAYQDIQSSKSFLGTNNAFCYPFGDYNSLAKEVVKNAGFKVAFTTSNGRVKTGSNKFSLPRIRILKNDSLNSFIAKIK